MLQCPMQKPEDAISRIDMVNYSTFGDIRGPSGLEDSTYSGATGRGFESLQAYQSFQAHPQRKPVRILARKSFL
jgi:hypothetical protein